MNLLLISSLLGAAAYVVEVTTSGGTGTENSPEVLNVSLSIFPPGSKLHLGESVFLLCSVLSNSTSKWRYDWFRDPPLTAPAQNPRHMVSGGGYSITGITGEDTGSYRCQAEWRDGNSTVEILSQPVTLTISDTPHPLLTMTPNSRYIFTGESFTLHCPESYTSTWRLKHFSQLHSVTSSDLRTDRCSPLGGTVTPNRLNGCMVGAVNGSSGLYWCESGEDRTGAVNITVSSAPLILRTPASPVTEGHRAVLYCQYRTAVSSRASFYKNEEKLNTHTSNKTMTIENVRQEDQGFYKCKSEDGNMESAESWLSVLLNQGNTTDGEADSSNDLREVSTVQMKCVQTRICYGKWIIVSCIIVLLFLIPVSVWLVWRNRYKAVCTHSCRPHHREDVPAVELPVTKQNETEVQWDLSWMEMSNLLDKNIHPGT